MQHFSDHQSYRRRSSRLLVSLFLASVFVLLAAMFSITYFAIVWQLIELPIELAISAASITTGIAAVIMLVAVIVKMAKLARGGIIVAQEIGGEFLGGSNLTLQERQLLNVVDEMAVAASLPSPGVYILRDEQGINAFTAGSRVGNAVIGVTQGALDHLSREQLQAVVAHEFGHIVNGDVVLNYRMISLLFGIECLYIAGQRLMGFGHHTRWGWRSGRNSPSVGIAVAGFVLFLLGAGGRLCADLIKQAVNRQREYLADAMSTEFTRNPSALVGAFHAIEMHRLRGRVLHSHAGAIAQLFIIPPIGQLFSKASHPSTASRIKRLEQMGAKYVVKNSTPKPKRAKPSSARNPIPEHSLLFVAQQVLANVPAPCWEAAHDRNNVLPLLIALLVNSAPEEDRERQHQLALKPLPADQVSLYQEYRRLLESLPSDSALAVASICAPALNSLELPKRQAVLKTLLKFIKSDNEVSVLEWSVLMIIEGEINASKPSTRKINRLNLVHNEIECVSAALIYHSSLTDAEQQALATRIEEQTGIKVALLSSAPNLDVLANAVRTLKSLDKLPINVLLKLWSHSNSGESRLIYDTLNRSFID